MKIFLIITFLSLSLRAGKEINSEYKKVQIYYEFFFKKDAENIFFAHQKSSENSKTDVIEKLEELLNNGSLYEEEEREKILGYFASYALEIWKYWAHYLSDNNL